MSWASEQSQAEPRRSSQEEMRPCPGARAMAVGLRHTGGGLQGQGPPGGGTCSELSHLGRRGQRARAWDGKKALGTEDSKLPCPPSHWHPFISTALGLLL